MPRSGGVAAAALRTMSASVPTGADDRAYSHYYYSSADETDGPWNGAGKFDSLTLNNPHLARAKPAGRFSSRGVHGNGEDWDPMGPMGFPWEWELRRGSCHQQL